MDAIRGAKVVVTHHPGAGSHRGEGLLPDKRRSPRVSFQTEVWLGQDGIFTRTHERFGVLSAHGAFLELRDSYSIGTVLSFKFVLPGGERPILCTACVRHCRPGRGIGVEFLDLTAESQARISTFVSRLADESSRSSP
jgi:hypothetical protein